VLRFPEYLEAWGAARKAADPAWTWIQAAAALGVTDEATLNWRRGVSLPPRARTERLVELVGDPALRDLIEADRLTMAAQRREARASMPSRSQYPTPRTLVIRADQTGGVA
jgi:hypothetical protein